ncbi:MAG: Winged helix DNA-binding domain [Pseudomonadota bacterium]|jgi:DNA-binding MarR family transcriptional regulator
MADHPTETLHVRLRRALRELERLEASMLERSGVRLRPGSVPLLAALLEASPLGVTELCELCQVEPSTMTGLLRTLESKGLITRTRVVLDPRRQAVTLTPRGRAAARGAVRARARTEEMAMKNLPATAADALKSQALEALTQGARTAAAEVHRR